MKKFGNLLKEFIERKTLLFIGICILIAISLYIILTARYVFTNNKNDVNEVVVPTQAPYTVTKTTPTNGDANINPGEIQVSFDTNQQILSENSFTISISPTLPYGWKLISHFPTKHITYQVLGGLKHNTTYTVVVSSKMISSQTSWSFTTTNEVTEDSSNLQYVNELDTQEKYNTFFSNFPYETSDFTLSYEDIKTLDVTLKNQKTDKIVEDVNTWIRSQGMDPAIFTINYITPTPSQQ